MSITSLFQQYKHHRTTYTSLGCQSSLGAVLPLRAWRLTLPRPDDPNRHAAFDTRSLRGGSISQRGQVRQEKINRVSRLGGCEPDPRQPPSTDREHRITQALSALQKGTPLSTVSADWPIPRATLAHQLAGGQSIAQAKEAYQRLSSRQEAFLLRVDRARRILSARPLESPDLAVRAEDPRRWR